MNKNNSIKLNQDGVIHHLGLILLALVFVGALGFAAVRVVQSQAENSSSVTVEEEDGSEDETPETVSQESPDNEEGASNDL